MSTFDTSKNEFTNDNGVVVTYTSTHLIYFFSLFPLILLAIYYPSIQWVCASLFIIDFIMINFIDYLYFNTSGNLKSANMKVLNALNNGTSIDGTIGLIEDLQRNLLTLKRKKLLFSLFCHKKAMTNILGLESVQINGTLKILAILRSDLQLRLEEQQKSLEQAKSEVEKNIHGTTELEQVSELQKARLDRQIEQFEELQKVLVHG